MPVAIDKINSLLTGVWALDSALLHQSATLTDTPVPYPLNDFILGRALFTSGGYMNGTVTLNHYEKSTLSTGNWSALTDDEILTIVRTMSTYSGPWRLYEQDNEVWLSVDVEIALNPSWEGSPQLRRKVEITERKENDGEKGLYLTLSPTEGVTLPVRFIVVAIIILFITANLGHFWEFSRGILCTSYLYGRRSERMGRGRSRIYKDLH